MAIQCTIPSITKCECKGKCSCKFDAVILSTENSNSNKLKKTTTSLDNQIRMHSKNTIIFRFEYNRKIRLFWLFEFDYIWIRRFFGYSISNIQIQMESGRIYIRIGHSSTITKNGLYQNISWNKWRTYLCMWEKHHAFVIIILSAL